MVGEAGSRLSRRVLVLQVVHQRPGCAPPRPARRSAPRPAPSTARSPTAGRRPARRHHHYFERRAHRQQGHRGRLVTDEEGSTGSRPFRREILTLFTLEGFRTVRREGRPRRSRLHGDGECLSGYRRAEPERHRRTQITGHRHAVDRHCVQTSMHVQLADLPGSRSMFAILSATPAVQVGHFEVGGSSGDSGSSIQRVRDAAARIGRWSRASA